MDFVPQSYFLNGWSLVVQLYRPIKTPEKVSLIKCKTANVQAQARQVAEHYARLGDYIREIRQTLSSVPDKLIEKHPEAMFDLYGHYYHACYQWDQTEELRTEWRALVGQSMFPEMVEALFMAEQFKTIREKLLVFGPVSNEEIRACQTVGVYRRCRENNYSHWHNQYMIERKDWNKQHKINKEDFLSADETDEDECDSLDSNFSVNCYPSDDDFLAASSCAVAAPQANESDPKNGSNDQISVFSFSPPLLPPPPEKAVGEELYSFVFKATGFDTDTIVIVLDSETSYAWSIVGGGDASGGGGGGGGGGRGNDASTLLIALLDQIRQVCQRKAALLNIYGMPSNTGRLKRYLEKEGIKCLVDENCPKQFLNVFEEMKNEFYKKRWFSIAADQTLGNWNECALTTVTKQLNLSDWYIQPPPITKIIKKGIPASWLC